MNIKALMHVAEMTEVEKLWVGPSVADESLAIGACFHAALEKNPGSNVSLLENVYLGPECDAASIERLLSENGVSSRYTVLPAQGPREIAALLARGKVIGRVAGRMEFGARALGNRSILADPRSPSMIRVINDKIKNRDFWMPFAPAILEERAGDYLLNPKELRSPYMALSFHSTELARKHLAAALHPADFTLRPQIVEQRSNPGYHAILCEFEKATGVGGLLNTSFNLHGSPIVRTPRDAFDVFERTDLDALVLDGYVIVK
jgi:carbamoyltransferase